MKDYYNMVKKIMTKHPETRDDDMKLYAVIVFYKIRLSTDVTFYDAMSHHKKYNLPSYESVTRARRKVQENEESLRGKKYSDRLKRQEEYRDYYSERS